LVEQLIRNQQVVGSNPTGGSRKSGKHKAFDGDLVGHGIDLLRTVRERSKFVKEGYAIASISD
jgi:hypothetical protein